MQVYTLIKGLVPFVLLSSVVADHILFMHTCSTYSHRVPQWPIVEALVEKGHNVTFLSPWGPSGSLTHPKVKEIVPEALHKKTKELLEGNFDVNYRAWGVLPPMLLVMDLFCYQVCEAALNSPEIQDWIKSKPKVDLVVGDMVTECSYGIAEKFGAKHILFSPIALVTEHFEAFGINPELSSIPDYDVTKKNPLGFFDRVTVSLVPLWYRVIDSLIYPWYKTLFKNALGIENLPDVYQLREKTNLIITNGDFISDYARSWPPTVVKVEGIHIKKDKQKKPLPKDVETFINKKNENGTNNDGFVFMSFGTVAKAHSLPIELRQIFFKTVESFPNVRFLWRWEGEKPDLYPSNLMLVKWLDQQDVLAHPKIRAFLTQAGRPSTQEALYHNVPMIAFPILADQDFNAQRSANLGVAILQDVVGLTEEKLKHSVNEILTNKKYKERVKQISNLAKDVPMDPLDLAVWWIHFVLRHTTEEMDLMKPLARHLSWIQKRDLDVWAFIFIIFSIGCYAAFHIVKKLLNRYVFSDTKVKKGSANGVSSKKVN